MSAGLRYNTWKISGCVFARGFRNEFSFAYQFNFSGTKVIRNFQMFRCISEAAIHVFEEIDHCKYGKQIINIVTYLNRPGTVSRCALLNGIQECEWRDKFTDAQIKNEIG